MAAESPTECRYRYVSLPDGRTVSLFVNPNTGLIVVDVVAKDEQSGVEILRQNV